ncbi:MAG: hypothetical protein GDA56_22040 [Hormoscilla sp. GM7CHS1pb]|nr:hypothetical protein [Hormoscilla sp. GM7CHS1pb]
MDEKNQAIAVQISIAKFEPIEEILDNFGLAKLMSEVEGEDNERLSKDEALKYYRSLKDNHGKI